MAEHVSKSTVNQAVSNSPRDAAGLRVSLPLAGFVLLVLTHAWPWLLPDYKRWDDLWIGAALGQLTFWPLFLGLVGFRHKCPIAAISIGTGVGVASVWICFWQFTSTYEDSIAPLRLSFLGLANLLILILLAVVIDRNLGRDRGPVTRVTFARTIRRTALAATAIFGVLAIAAIIQWFAGPASIYDIERWPSIALWTIAALVSLVSAAALWAALAAMVRVPSPREWRRALIGLGVAGPIVAAAACWFAMPYVRHYNAANELIANGVQVTGWNFSHDNQRPYSLLRAVGRYTTPVAHLAIDGEKVTGVSPELLQHLIFDEDSIGAEVAHPDKAHAWLESLAHAPVTWLRIAPPDGSDKERVRLDDATMALIANLKHVQIVEVHHADISAASVQSLARLLGLYELKLVDTPVDDEAVSALSNFPSLERLTLERAGITDAGVAYLSNADRLWYLALDGNAIRGPGLTSLAKLSKLTVLTLNSNPIDDVSLRPLFDFRRLGRIGLRHTKVTGSGIRYLSRLPNLHVIELDGTPIDDAGAMSLAGLSLDVTIDFCGYSDVSLQGVLNLHQERLRLAGMLVDDSTDAASELKQWIELAESIDADSESRSADQQFEYDRAVLEAYGVPPFDVSEYYRATFQEPHETCCGDSAAGSTLDEPDSALSQE